VRGIAGVVARGEKIWTGNVELGPPRAGPPVARVHLLRTGKRGDQRGAGSLEVLHLDDGWRVDDWDVPH
jgi:hypothetical protein